jgi:tRNA(fMet)-specific endonuclease VapC
MRGWLAEIRRQTIPRNQIWAYQRLVGQVEIFARWHVLAWDHAAVDQFEKMVALKRGTGVQDLKIASICLARNARLLTRNRQDFDRIPGLEVENWLE